MSAFNKIVSTFVVAASLAALPVTAAEFTPVGSWQDSNGTTRFKITFCGNNHELCAQLVQLSGSARTPENLQYLNDYVLKGAKRSVGYSWKGDADYLGEKVSGTLTLVDANTITISGCKGIACQKFELRRV